MSKLQGQDSTRKNGEGIVVTEGGQRVSGTVHQTAASAAQEAAQVSKRRVVEQGGSPAAPVQAKQQIFG